MASLHSYFCVIYCTLLIIYDEKLAVLCLYLHFQKAFVVTSFYKVS